MKVLLLGATGNLGSRLLPALLAHKHQVVVYVRNERKLQEVVGPSVTSRLTLVTGDATDATAIQEALVTHRCDALVNSAGLAAVLPWQAPRMQGIISAISTAAVKASKELRYPIRAWFLGGLVAMDVPGTNGTMIMRYLPLLTEHGLSFDCLRRTPREHLEWSLFCPSEMRPASASITLLETPRGNPLIASVDVPAGWQPSRLASIPIIGTYLSIFGNAMAYATDLEDCADFIAVDLAKPNRDFVGHRVSVKALGKGKAE
ncbi:hypothetical protein MMC34_001769 [Xylographa carneopallida]|nr:hypothetical protein [Xylographa carneopallida]